MTSEYQIDRASSSISSSDSDITDSTDNETFGVINSLITKKKQKKQKKQNKKSFKYEHSSTYQPPPFHPYYPPYNAYPTCGPNPKHQQIEEMYETLLEQIEYNKKRKLKRKRKKCIQKQQNIAAQTIQNWWKKCRVISKWKDPLLNKDVQKLLLNNEIANKYVEELIQEYFLSEFVPDLLIEILEDNSNEFSQKDVITQITWSYYERIEEEICRELCILICNETIHEIVSKYFERNKNGLQLKSILHRINEEIIDDVVLEQCQIAVDESIQEIIIQYLIECKSMELYNDLLPDIVERNVNITLIEYILEKDVVNEYLLNECLSEWMHDIAKEEYEKYKKQICKEKKDKEYDLIESCLITYLLDAEMLNILIEKLSTRSQTSFINNQAINMLIQSEMSKILIEKHMKLYEMHRRTTNNVILKETLMKLLSDTAIDHFITFLKHQ